MLPTKDSFSFKDTHTISESIEKNITSKWKQKENRGSYL